ncbi:hypothetical protein RA19_03140 [Leisingera sp. ANG-M1]|uniref:DUF1150 family protein n=1 Tax=Leisingera sp. ANG-M1 TaxID=1577895 RepID=UPI00057EE666|nr:DUF1150 family protein [Leisingera sp. ANG-M1]KIC12253.1 hypothetical protein RA19_03140 [Leisingera sp. ANG-M1]
MHTPFDFKEGADRTVYVKPVAVADLPKEVQDSAGGHEQLYAVHDAEGGQLALVTDRRTAYVLARQNDLTPVAVH